METAVHERAHAFLDERIQHLQETDGHGWPGTTGLWGRVDGGWWMMDVGGGYHVMKSLKRPRKMLDADACDAGDGDSAVQVPGKIMAIN